MADCLPMALLEAGATGLPTIATNVAAIPEVIREGETGFLIEPGEFGALVARLRTLIGDATLRREMGAAARRRMEDHFDAWRNGRRIAESLLEVAGAGSDAASMDR